MTKRIDNRQKPAWQKKRISRSLPKPFEPKKKLDWRKKHGGGKTRNTNP